MRIALGVIGGAVAEFVFRTDSANGVLVGVLLYLASYYIARYLWFKKLAPEHLGKLYTTGIGGYAMLFLFFWILLFTLSSV